MKVLKPRVWLTVVVVDRQLWPEELAEGIDQGKVLDALILGQVGGALLSELGTFRFL